VTGEACVHCRRALDAATAWRVAIAVVGPDGEAGPERAVGDVHPRCLVAFLTAQNVGGRRRPAAGSG
jgi:hypothetical protein